MCCLCCRCLKNGACCNNGGHLWNDGGGGGCGSSGEKSDSNLVRGGNDGSFLYSKDQNGKQRVVQLHHKYVNMSHLLTFAFKHKLI